jgi:ParB family transcriptional regulator, chromosome partitioning protein
MIKKKLENIETHLIEPNPDNPRIYFRQDELDSLLISINKMGVQVPISVYELSKNRYILIDGERRLRVCKKLNFKTIPAIVQEKPSSLDNLLLMFNIHALREQWDYFTIANKIPKIINLFREENNRDPNEVEISEITGLSRGTIRRCNLIIELPEKFKEILRTELKKPKARQIFTTDFFLEMEQALKTVRRNFGEFSNSMDDIRDVLISKYEQKIFNNITDLRLIQKIATSPKNVEIPVETAQRALIKIFKNNNSDIKTVYDNTIGERYNERKINLLIENLLDQLKDIDYRELDDEFYNKLFELKEVLDNLIQGV